MTARLSCIMLKISPVARIHELSGISFRRGYFKIDKNYISLQVILRY